MSNEIGDYAVLQSNEKVLEREENDQPFHMPIKKKSTSYIFTQGISKKSK